MPSSLHSVGVANLHHAVDVSLVPPPLVKAGLHPSSLVFARGPNLRRALGHHSLLHLADHARRLAGAFGKRVQLMLGGLECVVGLCDFVAHHNTIHIGIRGILVIGFANLHHAVNVSLVPPLLVEAGLHPSGLVLARGPDLRRALGHHSILHLTDHARRLAGTFRK